MPNIGEVYKKKIQIDLKDFLFETHRSQTPVGTVEDNFNINLKFPTVSLSVPYEAISKNGRFLIINSSNQPYWVEPSRHHKKYVIKINRPKQQSSKKTHQ